MLFFDYFVFIIFTDFMFFDFMHSCFYLLRSLNLIWKVEVALRGILDPYLSKYLGPKLKLFTAVHLLTIDF
jgi:hypothetical protein